MTGESCQIERRGWGCGAGEGRLCGLCARCGEGSFWKSSGTAQVSFAEPVLARVSVLTQPYQLSPLLSGPSSPLTSLSAMAGTPLHLPSQLPFSFSPCISVFPLSCNGLFSSTPPPHPKRLHPELGGRADHQVAAEALGGGERGDTGLRTRALSVTSPAN